MMQALPVDIVQSGQRVMVAFYFQNKTLSFCQPTASLVLCIKESGVRISRTGHDFFRTVCLNQSVKMGGRKTVGKKARIGFEYGENQSVEAPYQVGFAPEENLVVRGKGNVKGLSHGISFIRYTNHSHVSPAAFIRHSRNACHEDIKKKRKSQDPFLLCGVGAATSGTRTPLDAFRGWPKPESAEISGTKGTR